MLEGARFQLRTQGIGECDARWAWPWAWLPGKAQVALGGEAEGACPGAPACGGVALARGCARRRGRSRARARPAGQTEGGSRVAAECRHISDRGGRGIPVSCGGGAWRSGGASSGRGVFLGPAGTDGNRPATGARQVRTQVTGGPAPQADPFLLRAPPRLNDLRFWPPPRQLAASVRALHPQPRSEPCSPGCRAPPVLLSRTPECKRTLLLGQPLRHPSPESPALGDLALTSPCPSQPFFPRARL